jgi:uncharacterized protein YjbJ (UPF0337 family)
MEAAEGRGQGHVGQAHRRRARPAEGNKDKLAGRIQERYGKTKEDAQREVDDFFSRY